MHENLAIVSPKHHTTRETQSATIEHNGDIIELLDTVGFQKKPKQQINQQGQDFTQKTIDNSDVLALITVADQPYLSAQEVKLSHEVLDRKKSLMIIVNKWDLISDRTDRKQRQQEAFVRSSLPQLPFVPVLMASAKENLHIQRILEIASRIYKERSFELDKKLCLEVANELSEHIRSVEQTEINPPRFIAISKVKSVPAHLSNVVAKHIRLKHPFLGTPLIISVPKPPRRHGPPRRPGQSR
jgi:GTP-binding protein